MRNKSASPHFLRRKFIRSSLVGSGLVSQYQSIDKWIKPMIDVVIIPTHAQTSPIEPPPPPPPPAPPRGSETFSSNGTFTVPANVTLIEITVLGGAGGGGAGGNAGQNDTGGNGGDGAMGVTQRQAFRIAPGDNLIITIGVGGAGGLPYTRTRRANGGAAGEPGLETTVTGGIINLIAQGGRGGGGGGGVIGGVNAGNPSGAWFGGPGQDGSVGGQGGQGFSQTNPRPDRDGGSAVGGAAGPPGGGASGMGAQADGSRFNVGFAGSMGASGQVIISW